MFSVRSQPLPWVVYGFTAVPSTLTKKMGETEAQANSSKSKSLRQELCCAVLLGTASCLRPGLPMPRHCAPGTMGAVELPGLSFRFLPCISFHKGSLNAACALTPCLQRSQHHTSRAGGTPFAPGCLKACLRGGGGLGSIM